ncbi:uncharacterized protein LOC121422989 [Lytechinus variegatus]|uniref:uncharacterized protein LOC121422989 n=1 Tax=Lytechinus variegatus TaxID=7654 RepID=UPI001BB1C229|nr:uncharacterized protein LOC121422989 [Lytechinus variegatus]
MRRQWIKNINRKDFKVKKHSVVCGIHFPDGKPTEAHPYPVLHMGYDPHKGLSTGRAPPKRRCLQQESETSTSEEEHGHVESSQEVEDEEENEGVQPPEDNITVMTYLSVSSALLVTDVDFDAVLSRARMFSTKSGRTFCVVDLFHKQAESVQATPV